MALSCLVLKSARFGTVRGQNRGRNEDFKRFISRCAVSVPEGSFPNPPQEGVSDFAMGEQRRHRNAGAQTGFFR